MSLPGQIDTYLFFDGNCAEAMRFYEKALGGKLEAMMTQADAPPSAGVPPGSPERILHASLALGERRLMASDTMAGDSYAGMHGFAIALSYPSVDEAKKAFAALSEGGKVNMPMGPTFWVESFGMLADRFDIGWMVSGGKPAQMG
jgi:PhnB protein